MGYWQDSARFLRELRRDFFHTGAVLPSSRSLGRALAAPLRGPRAPVRVLEVGPGTGAVTAQVLRHLMPKDQFDIVEINPHFVAMLEERFAKEPSFRRHRSRVRIIEGPVESLVGAGTYDVIISGLPMNNFPASLVRQVFRVFRRLLVPGGTLSFFEYLLIRQLKAPFVQGRERWRLRQVGLVVAAQVARGRCRRVEVYANVPPAVVRYLQWPAT